MPTRTRAASTRSKKKKSQAPVAPKKPVLHKQNYKLFWTYIAERHKVWTNKTRGDPKPWTENEILQKFKFTNVFRPLDPGTVFVTKDVKEFAKDNFGDYVFNIVLYRIYNKIPTVRYAGFFPLLKFDPAALKRNLEHLRDEKKQVIFTNAFMVSSFSSYRDPKYPKDKVSRSVLALTEISEMLKANDSKILRKLQSEQDSDLVIKTLKTFPGVGDFLSYQIAVDIGYHYPKVFDENTCVVAGPGCKRGLGRLFKDPKGLSLVEQMQWLVDQQEDGFKSIGIDVDELFSNVVPEDVFLKSRVRLNLMAVENCLCEISKYLKAKYSEGRPRNRYPGAADVIKKRVKRKASKKKVLKKSSLEPSAAATTKTKRAKPRKRARAVEDEDYDPNEYKRRRKVKRSRTSRKNVNKFPVKHTPKIKQKVHLPAKTFSPPDAGSAKLVVKKVRAPHSKLEKVPLSLAPVIPRRSRRKRR